MPNATQQHRLTDTMLSVCHVNVDVNLSVNVSVTHAARRYARGYQIIVSRLWPGSHIYASPALAAHVKCPNMSQMANEERKQNKNERV